jgi:hypothetical protein
MCSFKYIKTEDLENDKWLKIKIFRPKWVRFVTATDRVGPVCFILLQRIRLSDERIILKDCRYLDIWTLPTDILQASKHTRNVFIIYK